MKDFFSLKVIRTFFKRGDERSLRAKKNIAISFVSKGISILISFLIVPLTLNYIGKVEYGIWMTLSSIIHWFAFFDVGLGNGLRNKLTEALAKNDLETARIYISSAFVFILFIAIIMFSGFALIAHFINWNKVFNSDILTNQLLFRTVIMVFLLFSIGFVFNLLSSVLQAMQRYGTRDILNVVAQLVGLVTIFVLVKTTEGSLYKLCLVYAGKSPFVMTIAAIMLFSGSLKFIRPRLTYIKIRKTLPLINLGVKFFINQLLYLIVNQSSVILIAQFFGPEDVTVYNLAVRYMTIATMVYMMVLTPYLSAFTEAYTKKEFGWISLTIDRIQKVWILTSVITIILVFLYKIFFDFWVGNKIEIPLNLIIALAISGIIQTFYNKYSLFLNGIGKINLQLYLLLFQAIFFVPISFLFFKLGFGLVSLVACQIILYSIMAYFMVIQYKKVMSQTASGVWNR